MVTDNSTVMEFRKEMVNYAGCKVIKRSFDNGEILITNFNIDGSLHSHYVRNGDSVHITKYERINRNVEIVFDKTIQTKEK